MQWLANLINTFYWQKSHRMFKQRKCSLLTEKCVHIDMKSHRSQFESVTLHFSFSWLSENPHKSFKKQLREHEADKHLLPVTWLSIKSRQFPRSEDSLQKTAFTSCKTIVCQINNCESCKFLIIASTCSREIRVHKPGNPCWMSGSFLSALH